MAVASLTSKRMPATRFPVCHIRTPHSGVALVLSTLASWSVLVPGRYGKAAGATAERSLRGCPLRRAAP